MSIVGKMPPNGHGRRPRSRRMRSLALAPTLITLGNLLCGFAAIHFGLRAMYDFGAGVGPDQFMTLKYAALERVLPSFLSVGAGLVLLGMVLDMFDGLIARVTRSTTNFGGQLDSLADVVTFGVAPATLMVAFMTQKLAGDSIIPSPISDHILGRATWAAAAIYVSMTAVRLARFNVEHARDDYDHRIFRGMPSPAAAAVVVALILFQDLDVPAWARDFFVIATPVIASAIGLLMVSRIPYRRLHRSWLLGRRPIGQFLAAFLLIAAVITWPAVTLLIFSLGYGFSGPVQYGFRRWREFRRRTVSEGNSISVRSHDRDSSAAG